MFRNTCKRLSVNSLLRVQNTWIFKLKQNFLSSGVNYKPEGHGGLQVLTEDQKQQYESDGYVVVPDVFSKDHVEEMNKVLDGYVEQSRKIEQTNNLFVLDPLHTPDNPILLRLRCISNHNKLFHKTMCDPKLVDILSDLIGPSVRYINQEKVNMKPPESSTGSLIRWHQDWAFYPYTNDSLVTACISIDDSTRENVNGPLKKLDIMENTHP
ncbi:hypothetical protein OS493_002513 [Desmophyllum pertusum]|uniref:Phytanoyl-CoA dioxygenase n=1 Tax=Desmophyllum pertusum TaxID=174260 RepID=A0A9W9YUI2_9CNID|nr:hypothetical protein OS493_002513 [Desmophyllum pertusum]